MAHLFVSYSRKNIEIARKLTDSLKGQGFDVWIDLDKIPPTVEWEREIERGIEEADLFIFLLSPNSAASKICGKEIKHAVKNGKRLIPIAIHDIDHGQAPEEVQPLNWIFMRESDDFEAGFKKLLESIKTDYEWAQTQRQLQVKAVEWDLSRRERSFLLRGKELQDAELELAENSSKEPFPTDLIRAYVYTSKKERIRQRRIFANSSLAVLAVMVWLVYTPFTTWLKQPELPDWTSINSFPTDSASVISMNLRNPDEVYASEAASGNLYASLNGGNDWQTIGGWKSESEIIGLAAMEKNVFVLTQQNVWLSTDRGESWTAIGPQADEDVRFMSLTVNPQDGGDIYVGTNNGYIYRGSGGKAWNIIPRGYEGNLIHSIATNGSLLLVATEEGLWTHRISRNTWKELSLAGCSDRSDRVSALAFTRPYDARPPDGAYGFFAAVPELGLCDSDTLNLYSNSQIDLPTLSNTNISSIVIADVPGWTFEGYIVADSHILRKRIWYSDDIEWWKLKTEAFFSRGE